MIGPDIILAAKGLVIHHGKAQILDIPWFHLKKGEILALIGPNGSGKSTLLLSLNGLLPPRQGCLFFRGKALRKRAELLAFRRKTAMVFQEPLLFDTTVFHNVAAGCKIRKMDPGEAEKRVRESLARFHITHLEARSARKLSGGEARRTSLARALVTDPEILFLDEPFTALDLPTREAVIIDLEAVVREKRIAVVLVTHEGSEALRISDRILVMRNGKIVQEGSAKEISARPADPFTARFVGMENLLPGRVEKRDGDRLFISVGFRVLLAEGHRSVGENILCGVRPEAIQLHPAGASVSAEDGANIFKGKIVSLTPVGPLLKVTLDCGFPLTGYLPQGLSAVPRAGETFFASFKASAVHLLPAVSSHGS